MRPGWWHDHSLSVILATILVAHTGFTMWSGYTVWIRTLPFGTDDGFWVWWVWEYNISIVADTFGILMLVLLTKRFREVGSTEDGGQ